MGAGISPLDVQAIARPAHCRRRGQGDDAFVLIAGSAPTVRVRCHTDRGRCSMVENGETPTWFISCDAQGLEEFSHVNPTDSCLAWAMARDMPDGTVIQVTEIPAPHRAMTYELRRTGNVMRVERRT